MSEGCCVEAEGWNCSDAGSLLCSVGHRKSTASVRVVDVEDTGGGGGTS
jgi:hypothetical protein